MIGRIAPFGGASAPEGWLLCDGSAVSRTTYADLFAEIGTTYGVGDGSTTFNLPNLVAKFSRGGTPGSSGGAATHSHTMSSAGSHATHTGTDSGGSSHSFESGTQFYPGEQHTHTLSGGSTAGSHAHTVDSASSLPPYIELNHIIKAA